MLRYTVLALFALAASGCATAYYSTLEQFGVEKRDVLVDRVKDARGEQADAQKVFTSALEEFRSLVNVDAPTNRRKLYVTGFNRWKTSAADCSRSGSRN